MIYTYPDFLETRLGVIWCTPVPKDLENYIHRRGHPKLGYRPEAIVSLAEGEAPRTGDLRLWLSKNSHSEWSIQDLGAGQRIVLFETREDAVGFYLAFGP